MKTFLTRCVVFLCLANLCSSPLFAQSNQSDIVEQTISDMYTVAGLGGAGAILGLSTLSFVEEPGDHLKNIVVGGAIGVIVGVGLVAWNQADRSKDKFVATNSPDFPTDRRKLWHKKNHVSFTGTIQSVQSAALNFSF